MARWYVESKPKHRFFATEGERDDFIEEFKQEAKRQDTTIAMIEPHKLMRWQEATELAPEADPVEVYSFWLRHKN